MRIIPDIKATFGDTYFLGYTEKMKFDKSTNRKTNELEGYVCKLSSSELQGQIDVIVPMTVAVQDIKFNQKISLQDVVIYPYGKSHQGTTFVEMKISCTAKSIIDESIGKPVAIKSEGQK